MFFIKHFKLYMCVCLQICVCVLELKRRLRIANMSIRQNRSDQISKQFVMTLSKFKESWGDPLK
jgi:hypothetical protein